MCVFLSGVSTLVLSLYKYKTTQQFSGCAELWTLASAAAASCIKKVKQWQQCYSVTNRGGPTGPQGTANAGNFYIWKKSLNLHKITRTPWITAGLHNHALFVFFIKSSAEPEKSTWANHASLGLIIGPTQFGRVWVEIFHRRLDDTELSPRQQGPLDSEPQHRGQRAT